jgi:hypothetical protein
MKTLVMVLAVVVVMGCSCNLALKDVKDTTTAPKPSTAPKPRKMVCRIHGPVNWVILKDGKIYCPVCVQGVN